MAVWKMLGERGVQPENRPAVEDIKKVQRRLDSEEKKIGKNTGKLTDSTEEE
jgi:DNA-damage-inducible protein D